jgi:hypothetical protein
VAAYTASADGVVYILSLGTVCQLLRRSPSAGVQGQALRVKPVAIIAPGEGSCCPHPAVSCAAGLRTRLVTMRVLCSWLCGDVSHMCLVTCVLSHVRHMPHTITMAASSETFLYRSCAHMHGRAPCSVFPGAYLMRTPALNLCSASHLRWQTACVRLQLFVCAPGAAGGVGAAPHLASHHHLGVPAHSHGTHATGARVTLGCCLLLLLRRRRQRRRQRRRHVCLLFIPCN